jgi:hypothetical protein
MNSYSQIQKAFEMIVKAEKLVKQADELKESGRMTNVAQIYNDALKHYQNASRIYGRLSELSGSQRYAKGMTEYCSGLNDLCRGRSSSASDKLLRCTKTMRGVDKPETQKQFAHKFADKVEGLLAKLWAESTHEARIAVNEYMEAGDLYDSNELSQSREMYGRAYSHFMEAVKKSDGLPKYFFEAFSYRSKEGELRSEAKSIEIGLSEQKSRVPDLGLVEKIWLECVTFLERAKLLNPLAIYRENLEQEIEELKYDAQLCRRISARLMRVGYQQTK